MMPMVHLRDLRIYKKKAERRRRAWLTVPQASWAMTVNAALFTVAGWLLAIRLDPMSESYTRQETGALAFIIAGLACCIVGTILAIKAFRK